MKFTVKTLAAAAIATAVIAGAGTASAAPVNAGGLKAEISQKSAMDGSGVQQAYYPGFRRCFRVPVYRWRHTPFGWRRVFVGFRLRCYPRFGYRHHRGFGFRIRIGF